jgi:hypothetical protein
MKIELNFAKLAEAIAALPTTQLLGLAVLALASAILMLAWSRP